MGEIHLVVGSIKGLNQINWVTQTLNFSRPYYNFSRLLEEAGTGGSRELILSENDFKIALQQWRWCHIEKQTIKLVYLHYATMKTENMEI